MMMMMALLLLLLRLLLLFLFQFRHCFRRRCRLVPVDTQSGCDDGSSAQVGLGGSHGHAVSCVDIVELL